MKRLIIFGITALTLAATLAPINAKAANINCTQPGYSNQMVIVGGNCDIKDLSGQIQANMQAILQSICGNGSNTESKPDNKPDTGTENVPNVEAPDTDIPNADVPATDNESIQNSTDSAYAKQVVDLVNAERAKEGLSPLSFDAGITDAANIRAIEIQSSFSHTRPNGSRFNTVFTEQGLSYRRYGENIAYGQKTPQEVVAGWMNSPGHRANIMNKNYKYIGVGYQVKNGTAYWVQLFAA